MKITVPAFTLFVAVFLAVSPGVQRGALAGSSEQADSEHITKAELDHASFCAIGRKPGCNVKLAIARGLFPTGLQPQFAPGV